MIIYFVRHGDPNYETDSLTELGKRQAYLTAERLYSEKVDEIYASTMGRAIETAGYLAKKLNLPVTTYSWLRELEDDCLTTYPDGVKKGIGVLPTSHLHKLEYRKLSTEEAFKTVPGLTDNNLPNRYLEISDGLDKFLSDNGYDRTQDGFYYPTKPNKKHIAIFCHGAMMRSIICHLTHIPYQYIGSIFHENPCGVTTFKFETDVNMPIVPRMINYGDVGHLFVDGPLKFYVDGEEF